MELKFWIVRWQGGSDSEQESNEGTGASRKPQKRSRGKLRDQPSKSLDKPLPDLLQFHSAASSYGCLSLLKRKRSGKISILYSVSLHRYVLHIHCGFEVVFTFTVYRN